MFRIRKAGVDDAGLIAKIQVETWRSAYQGIVPPEVFDSLSYEGRNEYWQDMLSREVADRVFLVAEEGEHGIVGFCVCGDNRDPDSEFACELYAIYVLQAHQGQGIGRALFESCKTWALGRGMAPMIVWVLKDNPYRRFYGALGGEVVSERTISIGEAELCEVAYGWRDET